TTVSIPGPTITVAGPGASVPAPTVTVHTTTTTPAPTLPPSNTFQLLKPVVAAKGVITLEVNVPGNGRISAASTTRVPAHGATKAKPIAYGAKASASAHGASGVTAKIRPSRAATSALAAARTLHVSISVTYTPTGGKARTMKAVVTVRSRRGLT